MRRSSETQKRKVRELLRDLREAAGLRQVDLATRLKRPQSFVSKYESGEKTLDFLEVREVCRALGMPLVDFVRRYEEGADEG
ncbi:MAG: helix-turn-helix transcriptional regulator [Gammaproteobacteria bacterium]|nr:helix-turn-helix transcriptional regulator [Gammaproteobacteria bacterium]